MAGTFITFEGPDGAGKTSVLTALVPVLERHLTAPLTLTREPGGIKISEAIRSLILDQKNIAMDARTEALLFAASRRQHLVEVIEPALAADGVVICDRFVDSSVAYQGGGRQIGVGPVLDINHFATAGREPDLTLYLDVPSEVGLERIRSKRKEQQYDRLDQETLAFHQRVRATYLELAAGSPGRIKTIDATQDLKRVIADCLGILRDYFMEQWQGEAE